MWVITNKLNIGGPKVTNVGYESVETDRRSSPPFSAQLFIHLFQMVQVNMDVASGPHKCSGPELGQAADHEGEKSIGGDIKRNAEEDVS